MPTQRGFLLTGIGLAMVAISGHMTQGHAAESISSDAVSVTVDQNRYAIHAKGRPDPFAWGTVRHQGVIRVESVTDETFGEGQALTIRANDGTGESFQVFPGLPFVLHHAILVNTGPAATVLNKVPVMECALDVGQPAEQVVALGTGGLKPIAQSGGSYAWMAVVDPSSRAGVVGGWLTHERGSGVVFTGVAERNPTLEARLEYGRLRLEPGAGVASESFMLGWFGDARLGLEAWADAVAQRLNITLPPMPVVYCTWYDNVHGGAGNAKALAELSTFAARTLKPYGLTCVQIDDGWQMGDPKGNGPRKNFSAFDPNGPYPKGMQPTAETLTADGFTAGLWILPFGGTWNDPFFAPHQDWFVKREDGTPFDTAWGGTALDMTHPGAQDFVKREIRQAVHDWGYHYLKLDGLSTGAGVKPQYVNDAWREDNLGDGVFHDPSKTNIDAFRDGMRMIRETAGPQTFILGCCAPQNMRSYAGVFGLVDGMRMGPDNGGSWEGWRGTSPDYGSRNYHLNGRIWWSDPDPIYVRAGIPRDSARCIASWNAISGQMISLSDWLPTLPAERLDIIRRCIPGHGVTARPIDLFTAWPPRQWLATDERPGHQRRDVIGVFNWSETAERSSLAVAESGLPAAAETMAYDFWNGVFLKPFRDTLELDVPAASCRILATRPLLPRPFLLSTSRHVSQGILEVTEEIWEEKSSTLRGISAVAAADNYELRIVARAPNEAWKMVQADVSAADAAAGVMITASDTQGLVRAVITSPVNRDVHWTLHFTPGATLGEGPEVVENVVWRVSDDDDALHLKWASVDGVDCDVTQGDAPPIRVTTGECALTGLEPGKAHRIRLVAVDWSGRRSEPVEVVASIPKAPELPPLPPNPTVRLTDLTTVEARTGWGSVRTNASAGGHPLSLNGTVYENGMGVHAQSLLAYEVKPEYRRFVAVVGIDDEVKDSPASMVFKVIAEQNGKTIELMQSPRLRARRQPSMWHVDVAIPAQCSRLNLIVDDAGDGINSDHADWVDAGFVVDR